MIRLKYLIQKEFIQIRRNSFVPRLIVMFPVMLICVAPFIASMEVKDVNVALVDRDHSQTSQRLAHRIEHSDYFHFQGMAPNYSEALGQIEHGKIDLVAVIPQHYERDLVNGRQPQVFIAANSVNGTKGMMGSSYLGQIVGESLSSSVSKFIGSALTTQQLQNSATQKLLYNPRQSYKLFMIPALMAMLLVMLCGFLPAFNIVGEKEKGTIEQINVTPVSRWEFILAKLIPYWMIALFVLTLCLLLAWVVFGFWPAGHVALIYLAAMLLALIVSGLGLIVSNYSDTMQQAMFVMWFFTICFILLSGLFTPVQSMPQWAQTLTLVNPLRWFIEAMRTVYVRGGTLLSISTQLAVLTAFATVISLWAVVSYKKNN